jgi:hypothetical protein
MDSNGDPYSGAVLKFYQDGTTTVTNMATSNTGATQLTSVALNANGYPANGGSVFIPHIDQAYKVSLYPTQTAANANTGAIWTIDNLTPADLTGTGTDELTKVSSNDTTSGYLNGKLTGGTGITLTENSDGGNETLDVALTGDGYLISESNDHNNAPVAGVGEIWVKNDTPNRLYYTDDEENDFAISSLAQAASHIKCTHMQIYNRESGNSAFVPSTQLVENTFETIGPTGSGATNIWTALDLVPSGAVAVILDIYGSITTSGTGAAELQAWATSGDSSATQTDWDNRCFQLSKDDSVASDQISSYATSVFVPIETTNLDFRFAWLATGDSARSLTIYYRGFMTD